MKICKDKYPLWINKKVVIKHEWHQMNKKTTIVMWDMQQRS